MTGLDTAHTSPVWAFALAIAIAASGTPAFAESVADFYRGKTVTFIIGAAAGAAYDLVGRR